MESTQENDQWDGEIVEPNNPLEGVSRTSTHRSERRSLPLMLTVPFRGNVNRSMLKQPETPSKQSTTIFVSVGKHTRQQRWYGGDTETLHNAIVALFHAETIVSFIQSNLGLGLHIVETSYEPLHAVPVHETGVVSLNEGTTTELYDGCVLEVRNKLWRAALTYAVISETPAAAHDSSSEAQRPIDLLVRRLGYFVNDSSSSRPAFLFSMLINMAILASTMLYFYETMPEYRQLLAQPDSPTLLFCQYLKAVCAGLFLLEIVLRAGIACYQGNDAVFRSVPFWMDVAAVLPFYANLILGLDVKLLNVLRVLRFVRVLFVFRVTKVLLLLLKRTLTRAAFTLILLLGISMVIVMCIGVMLWAWERGDWEPELRAFTKPLGWRCPVTCTSTAVFGLYAECDAVGKEIMVSSFYKMGQTPEACVPERVLSPFADIESCIWFIVVTIVTIGYGDIVPTTLVGCLIAGFAMIASTLVLALPVSVMGSTFNAVYQSMNTRQTTKNSAESAEIVAAALVPGVTGCLGCTNLLQKAVARPARLVSRVRLCTVSKMMRKSSRSSEAVTMQKESTRILVPDLNEELKNRQECQSASEQRDDAQQDQQGAQSQSRSHTSSSRRGTATPVRGSDERQRSTNCSEHDENRMQSEQLYQELLCDNASDASSAEDSDDDLVVARFWERRNLYCSHINPNSRRI